MLANAVLVFFGASFLNVILVFRDDVKLWGLIFIPVFMPFSKILIKSSGDSVGEWRVAGFFGVFVCFVVLVFFRDFLRIFEKLNLKTQGVRSLRLHHLRLCFRLWT